MNIRVSKDGRMTIPKKIRVQLRIKAGDVVELTDKNGKLVLIKKKSFSHDACRMSHVASQ